MPILCSDSFNASNTGNINGRTLDNALGGTETKTWSVTGNPWGITSNRATSGGYAAFAVVQVPAATEIRALMRLPASGGRAALVAHTDADGLGPAVCCYVATSYDAIVLRQFNSGDFFGSDVASEGFTAISGDTDYVMRLVKSGNVYTGYLYQSDGVTLISSVSHDFDSTSFTQQYWGITPYTGDNIEADDVIISGADAPPGGNALLLQLMQHGQLTGGLL